MAGIWSDYERLFRALWLEPACERTVRFTLLDKITVLEPGKRIVGIKNLSLAEEYLADHFPGFPVMPGVLMLEAMTQAGAWLVRHTEDFAHSTVVLKEVRNVRYANFLEPGKTLEVTAEIVEMSAREVRLKASGSVDGSTNVSARSLVLERYNLSEADSSKSVADDVVKLKLRELFALLYRPTPAAA